MLLPARMIGKLDFCEHCVFGKQNRVSFGTEIHRTKGTLDYIYSDLWGPSSEISKGRARYLLTIIDDFSRKTWVYFLRHKNEVFGTFKQWKNLLEKQTGSKSRDLEPIMVLSFAIRSLINFGKMKALLDIEQ